VFGLHELRLSDTDGRVNILDPITILDGLLYGRIVLVLLCLLLLVLVTENESSSRGIGCIKKDLILHKYVKQNHLTFLYAL
jgi:hypothetical protein